MKAVRDWLKSADEYCFGIGSATTLGIFRILASFVIFTNLVMISLYWQNWFGEQGYIPSWIGYFWYPNRGPSLGRLFPDGIPRIDLIGAVTDPRITIPFYILVTGAALFTCLGLFTRYSSFILGVGLVSLNHRAGPLLHGGDTLMRSLGLYLAVSPCGRGCSVDRLIGIWRGKAPLEAPQISVWAQRLVAYNVALVYFTTIWLKWDGNLWRNFTATYYTMRLAEFSRFPFPDFLKTMWVAKATTMVTVIVEFALGTLVFFPPARRYVLIAGLLMHCWIEYSMNIPLFSFVMTSTYVVFYQGEEIQAWAKRVGERLRRFQVIVYLPAGLRLSRIGETFLQAIDPFGMVTYLSGESQDFSAESLNHSKLSVSRAVATRSMGGWIFLWIPGVARKLLLRSVEPFPVVIENPKSETGSRSEHGEAISRRKRR